MFQLAITTSIAHEWMTPPLLLGGGVRLDRSMFPVVVGLDVIVADTLRYRLLKVIVGECIRCPDDVSFAGIAERTVTCWFALERCLIPLPTRQDRHVFDAEVGGESDRIVPTEPRLGVHIEHREHDEIVREPIVTDRVRRVDPLAVDRQLIWNAVAELRPAGFQPIERGVFGFVAMAASKEMLAGQTDVASIDLFGHDHFSLREQTAVYRVEVFVRACLFP